MLELRLWLAGAGVNADYFSIRWTTTSNAVGGTYRVSIKTDDGARVYVDGMLILNAWQVQSAAGFFVDIYLAPGWHTWTIEYFEADRRRRVLLQCREALGRPQQDADRRGWGGFATIP